MIHATPATHVDLYQLTSLVPHWDADLARTPVVLTFFSRHLPVDAEGRPARGFLLWAGLRRCLEWLAQARFDEPRLETLRANPVLGPALRKRPDLDEALARWRFHGRVLAPAEGTPLWAGPAVTEDDAPLEVDGVHLTAAVPYLVVETDLLSAKLIETPLLSLVNAMTMVATKAAHLVRAAGGRDVLEFGSRRVHPEAAVDAACAAYVGGCAGTSNVEAHHRHGVPCLGTMDHFAVQAWERPGVARHETERAYFAAFHQAWPDRSVLLVDTYDTFGAETGIRNAVVATGGRLAGIRLDSGVTAESVREARALLDALGATKARIVVSGGIDAAEIAALRGAPVDAFGVGERLVTSADAPVGVGAVAKLAAVAGRPTMKLARGSDQATLPGALQAWRGPDGDVVGTADEQREGEPLLRPVWKGGRLLGLPTLAETRAHALASLAALPPERLEPRPVTVRVSRTLEALVRRLVAEARP